MGARPITPEVCPVCGEDVPKGALACPGCGADHETGWNEEATRYDGLGLPEESFDDVRDVEAPKRISFRDVVLWIATVAAVAAIIWFYLL